MQNIGFSTLILVTLVVAIGCVPLAGDIVPGLHVHHAGPAPLWLDLRLPDGGARAAEGEQLAGDELGPALGVGD